jgi:hypothetical protein
MSMAKAPARKTFAGSRPAVLPAFVADTKIQANAMIIRATFLAVLWFEHRGQAKWLYILVILRVLVNGTR